MTKARLFKASATSLENFYTTKGKYKIPKTTFDFGKLNDSIETPNLKARGRSSDKKVTRKAWKSKATSHD